MKFIHFNCLVLVNFSSLLAITQVAAALETTSDAHRDIENNWNSTSISQAKPGHHAIRNLNAGSTSTPLPELIPKRKRKTIKSTTPDPAIDASTDNNKVSYFSENTGNDSKINSLEDLDKNSELENYPSTTGPSILETSEIPNKSRSFDQVIEDSDYNEYAGREDKPNTQENREQNFALDNVLTTTESKTEQNSEEVPGNEQSPKMIDIPSTADEIQRSKPGLANHPGIIAAKNSIQKRRSPRNAFILLIGLAGAGKSSTLNFLFGRRDIAPVNVPLNTKAEIVEYSMNVPLPELGIKNSQLRIIDTPGLGASRGMEHDARVVATLNNYLDNHEDLRNSLPNVVLIFSKFDDNRMQGSSSTFVKMLKGYNMVRDNFVPTEESSNIIYVLTRFMSETKKVTKNPKERIQVFRNVIQNYTTFQTIPEPIVICVAENEAVEEELQEDENGNFKLPNKEWYPKNIIDQILNITTDPIGNAIFKSGFENRTTIEFEVLKKFPIFDSGSDEAQQMRSEFEALAFPIEESEVSKTLKEADGKIDPDLRKRYPASLQLLQKAFQMKKIKNLNQVPDTRIEISQFLQDGNMNPAMIAIFERAFNVLVPEYEFDLVVGHGYDVLNDQTLQKTPFVFEDTKFTKLGFKLPDGLTAETVTNDEVNVMNFYTNPNEYMTTRVRELGLQDEINAGVYKSGFRPGYNVIESNGTDPMIRVDSLREIRKFLLTLNEKVPLNEEFKSIVEDLPPYNVNDRDSVNEWTSVFEQYGTHIVASAYGGGEIQTTIEVTNEELAKLRISEFNNVKNAILNLPQNTEYTKKFENPLEDDGKFKIELNGGNHKFRILNLADMQLERIKESVEEWKKTLGFEAIMMKSKLRLIPLTDIVKQENPATSIEMQKAMKAWFLGTLKYVQPPTTPPPTTKATVLEEQDNDLLALQSLNQTYENLLKQKIILDREREELESLFTTTTQRPTLPPRPDPIPPTEKPVPTKTSALQYVMQCLRKIPAAYVDVRMRVQNIYNNIWYGTLKDSELHEENLERLVQEATYPKEGDRGPNSNMPQPAGPRTTPTTPVKRKPYEGPPLVYDPYVRGPGYGYDILHDRLLPNSPFYMDRSSIHESRVIATNRISYISNKFRSKQHYINQRLNTTLAATPYIPSRVFKASFLPGYQLQTSSSDDFVEEHRDWFVQLQPDISKLNFKSEFRDWATRLLSYNQNPCNSADEWIKFFRTYGTHVLKSAYSGGAIEFRPYGKTVAEIRQTYSPAQYLKTAKLRDKEFTFRVIGGNTSILTGLPRLKRNIIQIWDETIKIRPVWLLDDIKLIPIHKLFPHIGSSPYTHRIAVKAYNAYLDETLQTYSRWKTCEPNRRLVGDKCICHVHQFPLDGKCLTIAQYGCELDAWDDCGPNSYCVQTNPQDFQYGECRCRDGFRESIRRFCHKSFGETCFDESEHECDSIEQLKCKGFSRTKQTCQCMHPGQSYDYNQQQCLSDLHGPCGHTYGYGKEHKLKCKDPFICNSETLACY